MIYHWQRLTSKELARLQEQDAWVLLPIASTEQHGPHLPVGTDSYILEGLLERVYERLDVEAPVLALRPIYYGKSVEHRAFPGTITLSAQTLLSVLTDITASLAFHGFRRLIVVNSHGGNMAITDGCLQDLRCTHGVETYAVHLFTLLEGPRIAELFGDLPPRQFHAGAFETSLIYHFQPDLVKADEISPSPPPLGEGLQRLTGLAGRASWGWATEEVSAAGFIGDPQLASPDAGASLADWLAGRICDVLTAIVEGC